MTELSEHEKNEVLCKWSAINGDGSFPLENSGLGKIFIYSLILFHYIVISWFAAKLESENLIHPTITFHQADRA